MQCNDSGRSASTMQSRSSIEGAVTTLLLIVVCGLLANQAAARSEADDASYLSDVRVEMRDGVELSADIWLPKESGPHPAILLRTPYTKQAGFLSPDYLGKYFAAEGYAVVVQDVRGKGLSDGDYRDGHQEPNDGYDSIEWIATQDWSNGRVCMMGLSYLGWVQWLAVKAQPVAPELYRSHRRAR